MVLQDSHWHFPGPSLSGATWALHRCAWREPMRAGLVDRPGGTGDVLLMYFHDPVTIDDQAHPAGSLRCWPEGAGHHYGQETAPWSHSWVHMSGRLARRIAAFLPATIAYPADDPLVLQLELLCRQLQQLRDPGLAELGLRALERCLVARQATGLPPAWADLRSWIDQHLHTDLSLTRLANQLGLAKSRFSDQFKHYFDTSPMQYVLGLRLERAAWLLGDHNRSIASVAGEVGYQDQTAFGRLFRLRFGCSPSGYRRAKGNSSGITD